MTGRESTGPIARFLTWWRKQAMVEHRNLNLHARWLEAVSGLPNPCGDGHVRLYLTDKDRTHSAVICRVCSKPLSRPEWMDCSLCAWWPIDGHLAVAHCPLHIPEPPPEVWDRIRDELGHGEAAA